MLLHLFLSFVYGFAIANSIRNLRENANWSNVVAVILLMFALALHISGLSV